MDIVQTFAGFLIDISVKATVLLVLAGLSAWLLRRRSSAVRHGLWSLTLMSLILLPFAASTLPAWRLPVLPASSSAGVAGADNLRTESASTATSGASNNSDIAIENVPIDGHWRTDRQSVSKTRVSTQPPRRATGTEPQVPAISDSDENNTAYGSLNLVVIWGVGVFLLAMMVAGSIVRTLRFCRQSASMADAVWYQRLAKLSRRLQLRRTVDLKEHADPIVPLTCGVLRPVVVLPRQAAEWDDTLQRTVLMHELAHVKRWDVLCQLIGRLACTLYWFHPLAWFALRKLRQEGEQACDDAVIHAGEKASKYAEQLLRVAELCCATRGLSMGVAMAEGNNLEQRVKALFDQTRDHGPVRQGVAFSMLLAGGLLLGTIAIMTPVSAAPPESGAAGSERKPARETADHPTSNSTYPQPAKTAQQSTPDPSPNTTAASSASKRNGSIAPLDNVIWWEKVGGLQAGFLLDSPGPPNQRVPLNSDVRYRILLRNTTDHDIMFTARSVPVDYRDAPYLIPSDDITQALAAPELPEQFRATKGRQGWKYDLAYETTLRPNESTFVPGHRGSDEIGLYVGDGDSNHRPGINQVKAGMNWIVQPLQVWLSTEPGYGNGVLFEGLAFQTKFDAEGRTRAEPATRTIASDGGTILRPRIPLEVGTLNAAAPRNAKYATWGKIDQGLQCGIRLLNPKPSYVTGDTLEAELLWRNASDKSIWSPIPRQLDLWPIVKNAEHQELTMDSAARYNLLPVSLQLLPGEVRSLGVLRLTLVESGTPGPKTNTEPGHLTVEPGTYKLSGSGGVSVPDGGRPRSGEIAFRVISRDTSNPAGDSAEDLELKRKAARARVEELGGEVDPYDKTTVAVTLWKTKADDNDLETLKCFNMIALGLLGTKITDDGLAHLKGMKRLGDLDLCDTKITDKGLAHLGQLPALESLSLIRTGVTDAGMKHLKPLKKLYMLILTGTAVTDKGLVHLGELPKLRTLILGQTSITDDGLRHLQNLKTVTHIRLNATKISDKGLEYLSRMSELTTVELSQTNITGPGLRHLPVSVKSLWLPSTQIDDDGLKHLSHLKNLKKLILNRTKVTDVGLQRLKADLPNCKVQR